jgi:CubicO group peptidase (beta-lactamase class C family)
MASSPYHRVSRCSHEAAPSQTLKPPMPTSHQASHTDRRPVGSGIFSGIALLLILGLAGCQEVAWERGKGDLEAAELQSSGLDQAGTSQAQGNGAPWLPLLDRRNPDAGVGLDSILTGQAVERARNQSRLHTMLVARHGEVLLEEHFRGPGLNQPVNVKSVSKSLLSAVVGQAIAEGELAGVDAPIGPFFPDYVEGEGLEDAPWAHITVADLLSMSSGLESTSFRNYGRWVTSSNWVRWALSRPMVFEPGDRMLYSTGNSHLVSAILTRTTGTSTHAFARRTLAEPLNIQLPPWPTDPQGIYFGGNDMLISPRGLLRFGELYRQGGTLDGQKVLEQSWIEDSWTIRVRSRRDGNGYGLGWWARDSNGHDIRFAWGYGGQFLFIVPELELTVVFTSDPWSPREGGHNRVLHDLLDDYLVPAAVRGS